MKSAYREFCRDQVRELKGDQSENYEKFSLKEQCQKLLRVDARERKAKRKAKKAARKAQR